MENKNCSDKITCPTCKIELNIDYLGKRCPRCNAVVILKGCENCKGCK